MLGLDVRQIEHPFFGAKLFTFQEGGLYVS